MRSSDGDAYLVTGAAGFLGSHLTFRMLEQGQSVIALARAAGDRSALERLEALARVLDWRGDWPPPGLTVVETDLDEPWLGLGPWEATALLRRSKEVIHAAARVDFAAHRRDEILHTNAWSLAAWLPLLVRTGTPFNLVSTAYVAGEGTGQALEEPVREARWRNPYEESKILAERWVLDELAPTGVPWRILRPSILVGDSATGRAASFPTVYVLWELLDGLRRGLDEKPGDEPLRLRVRCDPQASLALVPVDYVVDAIRALIARPRTREQIFHLTPNWAPTLESLGDLMASWFAPLAPEAASPESFEAEPADRRERLLARGLRIYEPYLSCRTRFDTRRIRRALTGTGLAPPEIHGRLLKRLVDHARRMGWGRRRSHETLSGGLASGLDEAVSFFDRYLPAWLGDPLLPGVRSLTVTFEVALTDLSGFVRSVEIRGGRLVRVGEERDDAACRYELPSDVFRSIAAGKLDPREAFFTRKTEIRGDLEAGLAVATLMIDFFRRYPYQGLEPSAACVS